MVYYYENHMCSAKSSDTNCFTVVLFLGDTLLLYLVVKLQRCVLYMTTSSAF